MQVATKGEKRKMRKRRKRKQEEGVICGVVPLLLLAAPLVVRGMETCVILGSCSSL
jgi:hypothetical protein